MRREILSRLINIAEYSCHMLKPLIANSSLGTFLDHGSENWNISCHISKQECHSHQRFLPSKYESLNPKGTEEGEQYLRPGRLQDVATPSGEHWGTQDPENIGYWPQGAEMHMAAMIAVSPDSFIFPYTVRLTKDNFNVIYLFFAISSNLFRLDYISFSQQKKFIGILAPPFPLPSSSSELSDKLFRGCSLPKVP